MQDAKPNAISEKGRTRCPSEAKGNLALRRACDRRVPKKVNFSLSAFDVASDSEGLCLLRNLEVPGFRRNGFPIAIAHRTVNGPHQFMIPQADVAHPGKVRI